MRSLLEELFSKREFHIAVIVALIALGIFIVGVIVLKYSVQGETNLPFSLSKIAIISSSEGIDQEDTENKWNLKVNENNDFYIYINKNNNYNKTETIKEIKLDNFEVTKELDKGKVVLYKPSETAVAIFENTQENVSNEIVYTGDLESNIKQCKISNQGGLVVFRYSLDDLGTYISNEDEQINHEELLKKIGITSDDLRFNLSFDISILLDSGKAYKAQVVQGLPINDIVTLGTTQIEITDMNDIIFKRIENN